MTLATLTLVVGITLAGIILFLVRRNHLHGPYALGWLLMAGGIIVIAVWPRLIDTIGPLVGIYYPPILVCLVAIAALLIKSLISDLERSRHERTLRRLSQKLAILERDLEEARQQLGHAPAHRESEAD